MKGAHLENPEIRQILIQRQSVGAALVAAPLVGWQPPSWLPPSWLPPSWLPIRIKPPLALARSQPL